MRVIGRQEDKINTKENDPKQNHSGSCKGRLSIVGIGPGDVRQMSRSAYENIVAADVLVGYSSYIKLLGDLAKTKEIVSSGMRQEVDRAEDAIKRALQGRKVCLISSGDAGIYGMAGLVFELLAKKQAARIKIEIVPGIMAASACASLLGAPLAHDFAVVSLSDLLTDMKKIKKRLKMAAKADFVIVLYNPKSKKRVKPLKTAWEIIKKYRSAKTPVGIVKNAYRKDQGIKIITLKEAHEFEDIDMATTIIVGNSQTYTKNGYMVTPRGYRIC